MKWHFKWLVLILAVLPLASFAQQRSKVRRVSLSVGIHSRDSLPVTWFDVGLFSTLYSLDGLSVSLLSNFARTQRGFQLAGISNISADSKGVQFCGISNIVTHNLTGVQVCGVSNIAVQSRRAVQVSGISNVCQTDMHRGLQVAALNYASRMQRGVQVGLLNSCGAGSRGLQVGLVNVSGDSLVRKVGLVNVNPHTRMQMMLFAGNAGKGNLAVRFLNRYGYSILGAGTHYVGLNDNFSGCLFYRRGLHLPFGRFRFTGDVGFFHIENFENEDADTPERMYSLQFRGGVEYAINAKLTVMLDGGYSFTRHYGRHKSYEQKPLIEAGIVIF